MLFFEVRKKYLKQKKKENMKKYSKELLAFKLRSYTISIKYLKINSFLKAFEKAKQIINKKYVFFGCFVEGNLILSVSSE